MSNVLHFRGMKHLAIILDGNRRWARSRGLPPWEGHREGVKILRGIAQACFERGIEHLTVFAFSTENWKRAEKEVAMLMKLFYDAMTKELDNYMEQGIRVRVIGRREGLSEKLQKAVANMEEATKNNTKGQLNMCINYGGRAELVDAVKLMVREGVVEDAIDEELISSKIWMAGIPDPDLIIRTSGEQRLSGFLSWSGAYSEIYFLEKHWPEFTPADIDAALKSYENRDRRFGGG